jgi:hypothetical protein
MGHPSTREAQHKKFSVICVIRGKPYSRRHAKQLLEPKNTPQRSCKSRTTRSFLIFNSNNLIPKIMANFIEAGHSKNVANFEDLISYCMAYGSQYNPSNPNITITGLQAKQAQAKADIQAVKITKTTLDNATNAREILFKDFKKFATRVISALAAVSPSPQTMADAKTINRKIQGKRAKTKGKALTPPELPSSGTTGVPPDTTISASQQSFDSLIDHFDKLIQTVTQEPLYVPNETSLSVAGLNALLTQMQALNTGVISATTAHSNARIARDKTLYQKGAGLVFCADEVKLYVKSIFGTVSSEYKQISKLQFRKR